MILQSSAFYTADRCLSGGLGLIEEVKIEVDSDLGNLLHLLAHCFNNHLVQKLSFKTQGSFYTNLKTCYKTLIRFQILDILV